MGSIYPLWIEKLIFLGLLASGIYCGMLLQDYLSGIQLWLSWLCLLPIAILFLTEGLGRLVQSINTR